MADVPRTRRPLITKIKRPKEIRVIGNVSNIRMGFMNAFATPKISPTISAVTSELMATPGRIYAAR